MAWHQLDVFLRYSYDTAQIKHLQDIKSQGRVVAQPLTMGSAEIIEESVFSFVIRGEI